MHYKNGREAKNGDMVIMCGVHASEKPIVGILYNAVAGNDHCNGYIAPVGNDHYANLSECLHIDDARAILNATPEDAKSAPEVKEVV